MAGQPPSNRNDLLLDLHDDQPIYNDGQRPHLNDDDLLRAYNADHDGTTSRPSISYDDFVGGGGDANTSIRVVQELFQELDHTHRKVEIEHTARVRDLGITSDMPMILMIFLMMDSLCITNRAELYLQTVLECHWGASHGIGTAY
jgi:hypothetical protein